MTSDPAPGSTNDDATELRFSELFDVVSSLQEREQKLLDRIEDLEHELATR